MVWVVNMNGSKPITDPKAEVSVGSILRLMSKDKDGNKYAQAFSDCLVVDIVGDDFYLNRPYITTPVEAKQERFIASSYHVINNFEILIEPNTGKVINHL